MEAVLTELEMPRSGVFRSVSQGLGGGRVCAVTAGVPVSTPPSPNWSFQLIIKSESPHLSVT